MAKARSKVNTKAISKITSKKIVDKTNKSGTIKKTTQKIKSLSKSISKALSKKSSVKSAAPKKTATPKKNKIKQIIKKMTKTESVVTEAKNLKTKLFASTKNDTYAIKKSTTPKSLTKEQLALCKKKLLEMRNAIFYKDYAIKEFTIDKNELSDVLDEATINDLMSKEVRLRNREIFHLKKINKGLAMIQRCTYGVCQDCEENIPFERLIVRPETDMCISCKEASESEEMRNINDKLPKSQGLSMEQVLGR